MQDTMNGTETRAGELTKAQETALRALVDGTSIGRAARDAKVSTSTIARWARKDAAFRDALESALIELRDSFPDRRFGLVDLAANTLADVMMEAPDSRSRVRAAEIVLKAFGKDVFLERPREMDEYFEKLAEARAQSTDESEKF